jgi:hypothetical protein
MRIILALIEFFHRTLVASFGYLAGRASPSPRPSAIVAQGQVGRKVCDVEAAHGSSLENRGRGRKAEQFSHEQNWQKT